MKNLHPSLSWLKATLLLMALAPLLVPPSALGGAVDNLRLGGHFKSLNIHFQASPASGNSSGEMSSNHLRLDLTGAARDLLVFELSAENILRYADPAGLIPLPRDSVNRILDLETNWNEQGYLADQLFVDRLNLKANLAGIEWSLGRQAIGFGRMTLFSPLDVIAPFAPDALDTDVRPGVDALRAVRYFGLGGQIGAIAVLGDGPENNTYLATFSHNLSGVDLLGLGGWLRERPMAGLGLAGSLGGLGLKGEVAAYDGKNLSDPEGDRHDSFVIGAVEAWYRFENDLVVLSQYLYNGAGANKPQDYPDVLQSAPTREGLNFLLGRHYLLVGPSYEMHPLVKISGLLILNLEDDSFLFRPLLDISLSDNLVLQAFWVFTDGKGPDKSPPLPRSEFGSVGESGGLFVKYFF